MSIKNKSFTAISVCLLVAVVCLMLLQRYYGVTVLAGADTEMAAIVVEPDDPATRAAANYLAYAMEREFGTEPDIVTEKESGRRYISIRVETGEQPSEPDAARADSEGRDPAEKNEAEIIFAAAGKALIKAETDLPVYSVYLKGKDVVISVPRREDCFGAVKAVTDRWLQPDCGLKKPGELRASRAIIREQLSELPTGLSGTFRILSQNLRYIDDAGGNSVVERAARFERLVQEYQPDVIGTQECTYQWLQLLEEMLGDQYAVVGCSRLGPDSNLEEWNAILYRKDRFRFAGGDTFWLSNTPGTAATKLNYTGCVRICTWALLRDLETGQSILFSNTHLQDGSTEAFQEIRARQAEILFRKLRGGTNMLAHYPGFLTGDFNATESEDYYTSVTEIYEDAKITAIDDLSSVHYSYHGYGSAREQIDFCFHSPGDTTVLDYRILDDDYGGYVSDHYGVLVTAMVNGSGK